MSTLTKSEKLYEYGKCLKDYKYAIQTYLETFDATNNGYVPFKLFPKQKELIDSYTNHRFNIVMKPRQAGVSTTTAAFAAIMTTLADPKNPQKVLIAANKQETAKEFLKKIKDFTAQLPSWFGAGFDPEKNSSSHYRLLNGSEVKAVASSPDALRGYSPTLLIMDEAAFIDGGEEFYGAAQPALSTGGGAILISTPNGMDPLYHTTYVSAKSGDNPYHTTEMRWHEDPRYNPGLKWQKFNEADELIEEIESFETGKWASLLSEGYEPTSPWYEMMCGQLNHNKRMIAQELKCAFLGSGDNVIDDKYISFHRKTNVREPIREEWIDKGMWIWEDAIEGHKYILAADASSGSADDYCTVEVWDYTSGHQVAEYRGKSSPDILGDICYEYGEKYKAFVVVDITGGWGAATVLRLLEMEYPKKRLYYDVAGGIDAIENNKKLNKHMANGKLPGLNFQKNRNFIVNELEKNVRQNTFKVRSERACLEMDTFIFKNGRPDHMKGKHDDLLMGIAMCCYVAMTSFKDLEKAEGQTKAILDSWMVSTNEATNIKGLNQTNVQESNERFNNRQVPNSEHMWLFSGMLNSRK